MAAELTVAADDVADTASRFAGLARALAPALADAVRSVAPESSPEDQINALARLLDATLGSLDAVDMYAHRYRLKMSKYCRSFYSRAKPDLRSL